MSIIIQGTDVDIKVPIKSGISVSDIEELEVDVFQGSLVITKTLEQCSINEVDGCIYLHLSKDETIQFSGTVLNIQSRYRLKGCAEVMGTPAYPVRMRPLWVKKPFGSETEAIKDYINRFTTNLLLSILGEDSEDDEGDVDIDDGIEEEVESIKAIIQNHITKDYVDSRLEESGLTNGIKSVLLSMASKLSSLDDSHDYYSDLYNVLYEVKSINLSDDSVTLNINEVYQLSVTIVPEGYSVSWGSSDVSIATVDNSGLVTSVGEGSAIITATSGSKTAVCEIHVVGTEDDSTDDNIDDNIDDNTDDSTDSGD